MFKKGEKMEFISVMHLSTGFAKNQKVTHDLCQMGTNL